MYSIQKVKEDVKRLTGTTISASFSGAVNQAARNILGNIDPKETIRTTPLEYGFTNGIYKYYCPEDLKDDAIISIFPTNHVVGLTDYTNVVSKEFGKYKGAETYSVEYNNGSRTINLNASHYNYLNSFFGTYGTPVYWWNQQPINNVNNNNRYPTRTLFEFDSLTEDGTWNVFGSISSLEIDNINYKSGNGSYRFNIDTSLFGAIENTTHSKKDITHFKERGAIFLDINIPKPKDVQIVTLKLMSSATDYYTISVDMSSYLTVFDGGWSTLKFPLDDAIKVGFPVDSNIIGTRIEIQTTGQDIYNMRLDKMIIGYSKLLDIKYYSKNIFIDSVSGETKEETTTDTDLVVSDYGLSNILSLETAIAILKENGNDNGKIAVLMTDLEKEYRNYSKRYKTERQVVEQAYYRNNGRGYSYGYSRV